jgi:hypothetical protein
MYRRCVFRRDCQSVTDSNRRSVTVWVSDLASSRRSRRSIRCRSAPIDRDVQWHASRGICLASSSFQTMTCPLKNFAHWVVFEGGKYWLELLCEPHCIPLSIGYSNFDRGPTNRVDFCSDLCFRGNKSGIPWKWLKKFKFYYVALDSFIAALNFRHLYETFLVCYGDRTKFDVVTLASNRENVDRCKRSAETDKSIM